MERWVQRYTVSTFAEHPHSRTHRVSSAQCELSCLVCGACCGHRCFSLCSDLASVKESDSTFSESMRRFVVVTKLDRAALASKVRSCGVLPLMRADVAYLVLECSGAAQDHALRLAKALHKSAKDRESLERELASHLTRTWQESRVGDCSATVSSAVKRVQEAMVHVPAQDDRTIAFMVCIEHVDSCILHLPESPCGISAFGRPH